MKKSKLLKEIFQDKEYNFKNHKEAVLYLGWNYKTQSYRANLYGSKFF